MDTDCLICMGDHHSKDCNQRKMQHCSECHVYIRHFSDHSLVCSNKNWIYDVYDDLYVRMPLQRCNIGFDSSIRYYMNDSWRKPTEGTEAFSTSTGIYFRFVSNLDLELHSNKFVHARVLVIVKYSDGTFKEKLVLMTSKNRMITAIAVNQPFQIANAERCEHDTSLILAMSTEISPVVTISVFPINGSARYHQIRFDCATDAFQIPAELTIGPAVSAPEAAAASASMTVAVYQAPTQPTHGFGTHLVQINDRCRECHVPVQCANDHAEQCSAKWFVSCRQNVYVKIPSIRCVLHFQQRPRILLNATFAQLERDTIFYSPMSDTLFKVIIMGNSGRLEVLTTGFTRVRIPIVVEVKGPANVFLEKVVFITSQDRTVVCAKGSRHIDPANALDSLKYNTPIMVCIDGDADAGIMVDVHSRGSNVHHYEIPYTGKAFGIPNQLDVASKAFNSSLFDADFPLKKKRSPY